MDAVCNGGSSPVAFLKLPPAPAPAPAGGSDHTQNSHLPNGFSCKVSKDLPMAAATNSSLQPNKIVTGDAGYVLEDVPHLTDYVPDLPVHMLFPCLSSPLFIMLNCMWFLVGNIIILISCQSLLFSSHVFCDCNSP